MQYPTCRHIKEEGAYCGSPALRDQKYCYYHLMQRGRRLRRARALRDGVHYRLELPPLDNPYSIRAAITEIAQALASGQLDSRTAGKLLYAVQQASATNRRIEQMEAAQLKGNKEAVSQVREDAAVPQVREDATVPQVRALPLGANLGSANLGSPDSDSIHNDGSRIDEYPEFEKEFDLAPGTDIDAETQAVLRRADQEAEIRESYSMPPAPEGIRVGSPAYRVYREEAYQSLRLQVKDLKHDLRDYHEQKRQQLKKEIMSQFPALQPQAETA